MSGIKITPEMQKEINRMLDDASLWNIQPTDEKFPPDVVLYQIDWKKQGFVAEKMSWDNKKTDIVFMMRTVVPLRGSEGTVHYAPKIVKINKVKFLPRRVLFSSMGGIGQTPKISSGVKTYYQGVTTYADMTGLAAQRMGITQEQYLEYAAQEDRNVVDMKKSVIEFMQTFPNSARDIVKTIRGKVSGKLSTADRKDTAKVDELVRAVIADEFHILSKEADENLLERKKITGNTHTIRAKTWAEATAKDIEKNESLNQRYPWLQATLDNHDNPKYQEFAKEVKARFEASPRIFFREIQVDEWRWTNGEKKPVHYHPFDNRVNVDAIVSTTGFPNVYMNGDLFGMGFNLTKVYVLVGTEFVQGKTEAIDEFPEPPPLPPAPVATKRAQPDDDEFPESDGESETTKRERRTHSNPANDE